MNAKFGPRHSAPRRSQLVIGIVLALSSGALVAAVPADAWTSSLGKDGVELLVTPGIDRAKAEAHDRKRFAGGERPHFAVALRHSITPDAYGSWDIDAAGNVRWRLRIHSPDAVSLNFGFTRFVLPMGAELRVLDERGRLSMRPFTAEDNDAHGQLWTPILDTNEVVLELLVPPHLRQQVQLELGSVNHGYRQPYMLPDFAKSGSCNVDVVCPQGDGWRDQIRSSGAIIIGGVDTCSGALVNNAQGDLTPFFLTAAHCSITSGDGPSVVVYWNYHNSTCRAPGSGASGSPGDGSFAEFNTGTLHRATHSPSDFTLLEFDDPIQSAHNLYWSGVDARDQATTAAIAIHHPSVEEMRISFEDQPTTITAYLSNTVDPASNHIRVTDWDLGTTEPGSSGSPLYSPDGHIIGQLHGGHAACGNDLSDWYGRVFTSWTGGGTDSTSLQPWLDPLDTGVLVIDGRNEVEASFDISLVPATAAHCALDGDLDVDVEVAQAEPGFTDPVTLSASGHPGGASASFSVNPVATPGSSIMTLGNLGSAAPGDYPVLVSATDGIDTVDRTLLLSLATAAPAAPVASAPADGAIGVSTQAPLSWAATAQAANYLVEVDDDPAFGGPEVSETTGETSITAIGLAADTTYHWRVTAQNGCGSGAQSAPRSFTTANEYCAAPATAIPDNSPAGVSSVIVVPDGGLISDLDVRFTATHSWIGDLIVTLDKGGTTVRLLDRAGLPGASAAGCSGDNPDIELDDAAATAAETSCVPATDPGYPPGAYQPSDPLANFNAQDLAGTWTLTVSDNANLDTGTLDSWCLLPVAGPPPVVDALDDAYGATEDLQLQVPAPGVLDNDTTTGVALSATVADGPDHGTLGLSANGSFTYTPVTDYCGSDSFSYTASESGSSDIATVALDVACSNDAPVAVGTVPAQGGSEGILFSLDMAPYFDDIDGDALTFQAQSLPAGVSIDPSSGLLSGTPASGSAGTYAVRIAASDGVAGPALQSFVLTVDPASGGEILIFADGFDG